jgi:hypothetical protein
MESGARACLCAFHEVTTTTEPIVLADYIIITLRAEASRHKTSDSGLLRLGVSRLPASLLEYLYVLLEYTHLFFSFL